MRQIVNVFLRVARVPVLRQRRPLLALAAAAFAVGLGCQNTAASNSGATEPAPVAAAPAAPGVAAPAAAAPGHVAAGSAGREELPRVRLRAEGQLGPGNNTLFIDVAPPEGAKLTLDSPVSVRGSGGIGLGFPRRLGGSLGEHPMPLRLPIDVADGATGPVELELTYYWCTEGNEAACRREQARLDVELDLSGAGDGGEAHLSYRARGDRS